ncbi:MAG: hypothetical protein JXB49_08695 [Bacteroidales bacterium]|nr:hypothetical protein [Bacteroidales bacterium]
MQIKNVSRLLLIILCFISIISAQDDYETWLKQEEQDINSYISKEDQEFSNFLENEWKEFQSFSSGKIYDKPKPEEIPKAKPKEKSFDIKSINKVDIPDSKSFIKKEPEIKDISVIAPVLKGERIQVDYFGKILTFYIDPSFKQKISIVNDIAISRYWKSLSKTDYQPFIAEIERSTKELELNNWGVVVLLNKIVNEIYPNDNNQQNLFIWFTLIQSGFTAKVGHNNSKIFLLLPSENMLYSMPYFTVDNTKYWVVDLNSKITFCGSLFIYEGKHSLSKKNISMAVANTPTINNKILNKSLSFSYGGKTYTVIVMYNDDVVKYFENYPQTDFSVYFNASTSPESQSTLIQSLRPILQNRSEPEAVNILLRFVQTAFDYKTDEEHFGREKPLMPEETINYPFSDCEDRSILFAYLVRELIGLPVVGLHYPCHLATAVLFHDRIPGDQLTVDGNVYTICDPTYINADIGQCMPQFVGMEPEIIKF